RGRHAIDPGLKRESGAVAHEDEELE
ncbi:MAG: hypothetical protein QG597_1921, partial [Actinomycetota bacterium]|nr:hypothetical protein [Actinomycetota bacterium]